MQAGAEHLDRPGRVVVAIHDGLGLDLPPIPANDTTPIVEMSDGGAAASIVPPTSISRLPML